MHMRMRTMIDLGSQRGSIHIMDTPTSVDCAREVRFRRSFRTLVECMVPCCGLFQTSSSASLDDSVSSSTDADHASTVVTGTFFGFRKGRVSFCLQHHTRSSPLLLLEFTVPTAYLAREMQHGLLRIALECDRERERDRSSSSSSSSLFNVPVWSMYCNGRKVGFAVRRQMAVGELAVLKLMQSVSVGAGVLPAQGDLMYFRARFDRVIGSADSQSFHMINPVGTSFGQQLSVFLLRS